MGAAARTSQHQIAFNSAAAETCAIGRQAQCAAVQCALESKLIERQTPAQHPLSGERETRIEWLKGAEIEGRRRQQARRLGPGLARRRIEGREIEIAGAEIGINAGPSLGARHAQAADDIAVRDAGLQLLDIQGIKRTQQARLDVHRSQCR